MAYRLERDDRHAVCDDYRDDPSAGYGKLSAVSVKGEWRVARIHVNRRIDLLARSLQNTKTYRCKTLDDGSPAQCGIEGRQLSLTAIENRQPRHLGREHAKSFGVANRKLHEPAVGFEPTTC